MPTDREALLLQVAADVRHLQKSWEKAHSVSDAGMRQIERRADGMAANIERTFGRIKLPASLRRDLNDFGRDLGASVQNGSRLAQVALASVSAIALKLASDAAEIESAFDVAFKDAAKGAREFSDVLAKRVGRDAVETREAMTRLQLVLTGTGVAADQATTIVKQLAQVGIDAGSLFSKTDAVAFQKIISGISGEAEPLKEFGVVINEAAVKAELLRLGFKGNAQDASEAAKSIARANLIIKGLAVAQGDAERTAGSAANQTRALRAEFNAAARDLGKELLPAFLRLTAGARGTLHAFNELPGGVQLAGVAFLGLIAAGGPIAGVLANLKRVIDLARETRAALAGVTGASVAAGGAGAAGSVTGATIAGIPLVVGASVLKGRQYKGIVASPGKATEDQLRAALRDAGTNINSLNNLDGGLAVQRPGRANERLAAYQADVARLQAELQRRAVAAGGSGSSRAAATPQGGFTLSPDLMKPVAGASGGGGRGRKPAAAKDDGPTLAEQRRDAEREIERLFEAQARAEQEALGAVDT